MNNKCKYYIVLSQGICITIINIIYELEYLVQLDIF